MQKNGIEGNKTVTGLDFEKSVDFQNLLTEIQGYSITKNQKTAGKDIFFNDLLVAKCFRKHDFYKYLLEENVNWKLLMSKQLLPDDALLVLNTGILFIIEVKYQQVNGSVDEKLQTCDFKRKQYLKLASKLGLRVEYVYVLNDWFKNPNYKDVLDYIVAVNCHFKFNELPLNFLGLPSPDSTVI